MSITFDENARRMIEEKLSAPDKEPVPEQPLPAEQTAAPAEPAPAEPAPDIGISVINTEMLCALDRMNISGVNRSYRDIPAKGVIGNIKKLIKRVVRRLTFWYVEPCMLQQTDYNNANNRFSAQVNSDLNCIKSVLNNMSAADSRCDARINEASAMLSEHIRASGSELEQMKKGLDKAASAHSSQAAAVNRTNSRLSEHIKTSSDELLNMRTELDRVSVQSSSCSNELLQVKSELNCIRSEMNCVRSEVNCLESKSNSVDAETLIARISAMLSDRFVNIEKELSMLRDENEQLKKRVELPIKTSVIYSNADIGIPEEEFSHARFSSSQTGEDAIISNVFSTLGIKPSECSYLDLGANHSVLYSNTYAFYRQGARGVLVEANPDLAHKLSIYRPGDIVINKCLSDRSGEQLKFYILNGDGLSTTDRNYVTECMEKNPNLYIEKEVMVDSVCTEDIIKQYFGDKAPEILNIDVEGFEMQILSALDFNTFRPLIIICEMIEYKNRLTVGEKNKEIVDFMLSHGYEEYAFTGINSIFIDKASVEGRS